MFFISVVGDDFFLYKGLKGFTINVVFLVSGKCFIYWVLYIYGAFTVAFAKTSFILIATRSERIQKEKERNWM